MNNKLIKKIRYSLISLLGGFQIIVVERDRYDSLRSHFLTISKLQKGIMYVRSGKGFTLKIDDDFKIKVER